MSSPRTLYNQAVQFHQAGEINRAQNLLNQSLTINPHNPSALFLLAQITRDKQDYSTALAYVNQAIHLAPQLTAAFILKGQILSHLGQYPNAIQVLTQALLIDPTDHRALIELGSIYRAQFQLKQAKACYIYTLTLYPDSLLAHFHLGLIDKHQHRFKSALKHLHQAYTQNPQLPNLAINYGDTYELIKKPKKAEAIYQESLQENPHQPDLLAKLGVLYQYTCNWNKLASLNSQINRYTLSQLHHRLPVSENPFGNLIRNPDPEQNFQVARNWSRRVEHHAATPTSSTRTSTIPRPTLGYLSFDFRNHAVGHQMTELFAHHHGKNLSVACFSYGPDDNSRFRQQIIINSNQFFDLANLEHSKAASLIHQHAEIAIDLTGHTEGNRMGLLAAKPCPIQISYLGFPSSSGANFIDYIITDPLITPPSQSQFFSEKLLLLPHCYQVNPSTKLISPSTRAAHHLPEKSFVFACFSNLYKLTPELLAIWIKLLQSVPGSVLWLIANHRQVKTHLKQHLTQFGVSPSRLIFSPRLPLNQHLSRLGCANLCLDTTLYTGGATSANSLLAGAPLITLAGNRYVSRMTTSMLINLGLSELITHSLDDYYHLALYLATHPPKLRRIRSKLRDHLSTYPLFNLPRFASNLDTAYLTVWDNYLQGRSPQPFNITDPLPLIHKS